MVTAFNKPGRFDQAIVLLVFNILYYLINYSYHMSLRFKIDARIFQHV